MSVAIWLEKSAGPRRVDKLGRDSKVILADQALQVVAFCKARTWPAPIAWPSILIITGLADAGYGPETK